MDTGEELMGHTWSTVTSVQSGRRTFLLAFLRPSKACYGGGQSGSWLGSGLVATATYWRSHLVDEMSVCRSVNFSFSLPANRNRHTDKQQNGAIFLLVDNVGVEYLVIQGLGLLIGGGHDGQWYAGNGQTNSTASEHE